MPVATSTTTTPSSTTIDNAAALPIDDTTAEALPSSAGPSNKKQKKTAASSKPPAAKATAIKSVKTIDPAIINQRREAVHVRVLKLESKLAKDRALLAKYSAAVSAALSAPVLQSSESADEGDEKM